MNKEKIKEEMNAIKKKLTVVEWDIKHNDPFSKEHIYIYKIERRIYDS